MSPPTPPSPPIISRDKRERPRNSSSSHHRTARDSRTSRSRSRGRGRTSRSPERRQRHRSRSRGRSRETSRYQPNRRPRHERSRSKSRVRSERRRHNSHRSRSRSHTRTQRSSHRSRSRSKSRSHRRNNRSKSRDTEREARGSRSQSNRREERRESSKQPNVIVLSTESYKDSLKSSGQQQLSSIQEHSPRPSTSSTSKPQATTQPTPSWKTVKADQVGVYSNLEPDEPIDKEKIHKEIEEKLRLVLAREGKVYPYPKPEPSHPVFANDGSFLEIFKKMQQQQTFVQQQVGESMLIHAVPAVPVAPVVPVIQPIQQPPPPQIPVFSRRRGGKILKTGVVAKPKAQNDTDPGDVKDFWSIYLREVKKYKSTACESDSKTRPLVR